MKFRDNVGVFICMFSVVLFILMGLFPVSGTFFYNSGEVLPAVRLALSARHALENGDYFLRYANDYAIVLQPIFLYYTPVVYGIAGVIQIFAGLDPYNSLLVVAALMTASAVAGIYATIRLLGGNSLPSGIAAAMLPFAPYFATDVFTRGAFAEISAWAVLPWVIFFFIKFCLDSRWQFGIGLILTTAIFIACHKIFFPWTMLLLGILGVAMFEWRQLLKAMPGLAMCLAAALCLSGPYWFNAASISKTMNIADYVGIYYSYLTSNWLVFSPFHYTDPSLIAQYNKLSLQLGPPVVAAMVVGSFHIGNNRSILALWLATLLSALIVCSFFVGEKTFWNLVPQIFLAIQFPYRLLMLATTFGLILGGLLLSAVARSSPITAYACATLSAVLLAIFWSSPKISSETLHAIANVNSPNGVNAYFEKDGPPPLTTPTVTIDRSIVHAIGNRAFLETNMEKSGLALLPVQFSRRLEVTLDGQPARAFYSNGLLVLDLNQGPNSVVIRRVEPIGFPISFSLGFCLIIALMIWSRFRKSSYENDVMISRSELKRI